MGNRSRPLLTSFCESGPSKESETLQAGRCDNFSREKFPPQYLNRSLMRTSVEQLLGIYSLHASERESSILNRLMKSVSGCEPWIVLL
jgi:hypothetical protein